MNRRKLPAITSQLSPNKNEYKAVLSSKTAAPVQLSASFPNGHVASISTANNTTIAGAIQMTLPAANSVPRRSAARCPSMATKVKLIMLIPSGAVPRLSIANPQAAAPTIAIRRELFPKQGMSSAAKRLGTIASKAINGQIAVCTTSRRYVPIIQTKNRMTLFTFLSQLLFYCARTRNGFKVCRKTCTFCRLSNSAAGSTQISHSTAPGRSFAFTTRP